GDHAHARSPGQLAVRLGHVGRAAFLAADDEPDRVLAAVKAIEDGEIALAGDAEHQVDALRDEIIDEDVAAESGLQGSGEHGRKGSEGNCKAPLFAVPLSNWRARHDSNVRPLPSEGSTLSN